MMNQLLRTRSARVFVLLACLATIGCDRVTKHVAAVSLAGNSERSFLADTIRLSYAENTGGFLSLGADLSPEWRSMVFTAFTGVLLAGLAGMALYRKWQGGRLLGAALIVSGGASNWVDRIAIGSVIDFLNVGVGPLRTGIFNVADVAILCGVGLMLMSSGRQG